MEATSPQSHEVSLALDILGYRPEMIKWRRHCYRLYSDAVSKWMSEPPASLCGLKFKPYLTGSKVEGTTVMYLSDEDYMFVFDSILCAKKAVPDLCQTNTVWMKIVNKNVDPGYVLLRRSWDKTTTCNPGLQRFFDRFFIRHSDGAEYLSSETINKSVLKAYTELYEAAVNDASIPNDLVEYIKVKPAETPSANYKLHIKNLRFTFDVVFAFPCHVPELITRWAKRERKYGWPKKDSIENIMRMSVYLVPKSSNRTDTHHLEFRICHTFGEIELMKSLNETQIKLYVLLKTLFKSELDSQFPDIFTSYVLKNIVFWMCENTQQEHFKIKNILERLKQALEYILSCVTNDSVIPNYFIPERNLLDGKITLNNRSEICKVLSDMIEEGGNVVFRINTIQRGILSVRRDILFTVLVCHFRNLAEIYFLSRRKRDLQDAAQAAVEYLSRGAYRYIEKHFFETAKF